MWWRRPCKVFGVSDETLEPDKARLQHISEPYFITLSLHVLRPGDLFKFDPTSIKLTEFHFSFDHIFLHWWTRRGWQALTSRYSDESLHQKTRMTTIINKVFYKSRKSAEKCIFSVQRHVPTNWLLTILLIFYKDWMLISKQNVFLLLFVPFKIYMFDLRPLERISSNQAGRHKHNLKYFHASINWIFLRATDKGLLKMNRSNLLHLVFAP